VITSPQSIHWAKRLAATIRSYALYQDRDRVLKWFKPVVDSTLDRTIVGFGGFRSNSSIRCELWLTPFETQRAVATRELIESRTSQEVSIWLESSKRRPIRQLAANARALYPIRDHGVALESHLARVDDDDGSGLGMRPGLTVPATFRAPNPLFVVDAALFLIQVARLHRRQASLNPTRASYTQLSPGPLISIPGRISALSRFQCPQCAHVLSSTASSCPQCEWDMYPRSRDVASPYDVDYDDN
jgi:hypothetical protein